MSSADTRQLIATAIERLTEELPAMAQLKLVARVELRARGGHAPIWRVELPGPKIDRDPSTGSWSTEGVERPAEPEPEAPASTARPDDGLTDAQRWMRDKRRIR